VRALALLLWVPAVSAAQVGSDFVAYARRINAAPLAAVPVFERGRVKPADTLARETLLFLHGSAAPSGLDPLQCYLGYIVYPANGGVELIEVREPEVRERLGFSSGKRYFSVRELDQGGIVGLAQPLISEERRGEAGLTPLERGVLEAYRQYSLARSVASGEHFLQLLDPEKGYRRAGRQLLVTLRGPEQSWAEAISRMPRGSRALEAEVTYNRAHPSRWAALAYACLGLLALAGLLNRVPLRMLAAATLAPTLVVLGALAIRGAILGFAPATTLYSVLQWSAVALSAGGAGAVLRYRSRPMWGLSLLGGAALLALPEVFARTLSSAIDPVPAILQSNFWLSVHVGAATGAFAALAAAMLAANYALIASLIRPREGTFLALWAHRAWRASQVGACLLTAAILFGGIWANLAWGRTWAWEPKESWALLADASFISLIWARHTGRLGDSGVLLAAPAAFLAAAMACFGINGLLHAGLHTFGFYSGGAVAMTVFAALQCVVLIAAAAIQRRSVQNPVVGS
jgi:ABC-type transport system involved in cytochrome c biogenesis permease subunit